MHNPQMGSNLSMKGGNLSLTTLKDPLLQYRAYVTLSNSDSVHSVFMTFHMYLDLE